MLKMITVAVLHVAVAAQPAPIAYLGSAYQQASAAAATAVGSSRTATIARPAGIARPAADVRAPRGWNSYDSFTWFVNETQFLANCQYMADNLLQYGYDTCVIDYLWYQQTTTGEWLLDDYCRPRPDPGRWPSSRNGAGFRNVADAVHAMGLKFGIHIMRGTRYEREGEGEGETETETETEGESVLSQVECVRCVDELCESYVCTVYRQHPDLNICAHIIIAPHITSSSSSSSSSSSFAKFIRTGKELPHQGECEYDDQ